MKEDAVGCSVNEWFLSVSLYKKDPMIKKYLFLGEEITAINIVFGKGRASILLLFCQIVDLK
ncbi:MULTISPECIES: hypothetical protein [Bacillus]|uniref:hypothetical protein n=1 Tax=Bacillus TaxID=1386 RepID=UPI0002F05BC2|nr:MULTISPECIES: hypothetical protein [Bacillus cereus group]MBJ8068519.1 hypothetical protein [Bacillus cereus]MBJ8185714.1 hypothetical protein [Bacillus cereus]MDM5464228.1 hypothetical protein [Bacillus cereus]QWH39182.1 hypothetical protein EXW53_20855 [Bacillus mycoides]